MFGKSKKDPMVSTIKGIMEQNEAHRKAVEIVNEHFGITSRRALPHEERMNYDIAIKQVLAGEPISEEFRRGNKENLHEAVGLKIKSGVENTDGHKIGSVKTEMRCKLVKTKVHKPKLDESETINEVSKETLKSYLNKSKSKYSELVKDDNNALKRRLRINPNKPNADEKIAKEDRIKKEIRRKLRNKEKYIPKASEKVRTIKEDVDIAALHEEIAENIMKKYNSIYEDAEKLAAFNEALSEEEKNIVEQYLSARGVARAPGSPFAPNAPSLAKPFIGPEPIKINNLPTPTGPAPEAPAPKSGLFGMGGFPRSPAQNKSGMYGMGGFPETPPKPVPAQRPVGDPNLNANSPEGFARARQDINTQMMNRNASATSSTSAQSQSTTPTLTQTSGSVPDISTPPPSPSPSPSNEAPAPVNKAVADKSRVRVRQNQAKQRHVSAPMRPKRFGFGSDGSGRQDAGSITNRALGAVNESVEEVPVKKSLESLLRERYGH